MWKILQVEKSEAFWLHMLQIKPTVTSTHCTTEFTTIKLQTSCTQIIFSLSLQK